MEHLFVSYSPALGGAERLLLEAAAGAGGDSVLACPRGPLAEAAAAAGLRVHELEPRSLELRASPRERAVAPLRLAAQAREVRAAVGALEPRTVVAWSMRGLLVAAAALAGRRRRTALVFQHNDLLPGPVIAAAVRAAARRADRVVCLSHAVARDLDPHGRLGARLEVIHPGVDPERFAGPPLPETAEVLLLGALVEWKRPDLALEAVALAARELPTLSLTVAGGTLGPAGERLLSALRERAEREDLRGRVRFTGWLADPRGAIGDAACLLHCADREPFGIALVEALAAGRPVVAPAAGGPLEIVTGECGRLYPPGDARAAADALVEVLSDPNAAARLGAAGRERAEREFSAAGMRRRYGELLEGIAPTAARDGVSAA